VRCVTGLVGPDISGVCGVSLV